MLPVPIVTLYPGDLIEESNLAEKAFIGRSESWKNYATSKLDVTGKRAQRTLIAGQSIPLLAIQDAVLIKRGAAVRAQFEDDGILITTTLVPLTSGSVGNVIEAKQADGGPVVRAQVQADGSLKVASQ